MQRSGPEIGLDSVKVERRWFSWMLRTFTEQEGGLKALILLDLLWSVGGLVTHIIGTVFLVMEAKQR